MEQIIDIENVQYDMIIVGAGIAGSALAYSMGTKGKRVLCVERDLSEPDRIVGELMQPGGVQALRELGMEDCFEGIDSTLVYGYGIFKEDKGVKLSYPKNDKNQIINGYSFHHGKFVQKLRAKARQSQNVTLLEGTVKSLIEEDEVVKGVRLTLPNQNDVREWRAPLTVVCDGCNSNLRRSLISEPITTSSTFVGLILRGCQLPYQYHGHVFLVDPSPILMYRIGSDEIRVLVDVPGQCPSSSELKKHFETFVAPQLPESLREAFTTAVKSDQLKKMSNLRLHPQQQSVKPGVIVLGDAWNMRHPLTGGGMTVALTDVNLLSQKLITVSSWENHMEINEKLQQFTQQRKPLAATINVLAGALYQVFSSDNEDLRKACLGYLGLGGEFSAGPVALLSGLKPRPTVLAAHFFAVAFYAVFKTVLPFPTPAKIRRCYRVLCAASEIIIPLLRKEGVLRYLQILCTTLRLTK